MNKICLDLDDFSVENNNLWYIDKLREQYPNFKLSAFFIPYDLQHFNYLDEQQKNKARGLIRIGVAEGWLELIPHGVSHMFGEFQKADYKAMKLAIDGYEEYFKILDVPYVKGFKAPNWLISDEAIKCLDDNGWFLATDTNQVNSNKAKLNYEYNWSIDTPFKGGELVKAHGHISLPSKNNLPDNMKNLAHIPADYKWEFVSTIVKQQYEKKD
jgi:predicted deacetylase